MPARIPPMTHPKYARLSIERYFNYSYKVSRNWASKLSSNLASRAMAYLQIVYKNKEFMFPLLPKEYKISRKEKPPK